LNAAAIQVPIGVSEFHEGVVDLIKQKAYYFGGPNGTLLEETPVPAHLEKYVAEKREELLNTLVDVDDQLAEKVIIEGVEPTTEELIAAVRLATLALKFVPVLMGSAYKNKGVQTLLDSVLEYLPSPNDRVYEALDADNEENKLELSPDPKKPFVGFAFKLDDGKYGQLTYMRVYQGTISKGMSIMNVQTKRRTKVPRVVRMHSNEMEEVEQVGSGEICALFGVDCSSGTTFTDGTPITLTTMHVPKPVLSLSIVNDNKKLDAVFSKALNKFQKEDPTFQISYDNDAKQTLMSGMGELHLFIYTERLKREYGVTVTTGKPQVAFRETINVSGNFAYQHKKQSGGQGQYAKVCGYLEPVSENSHPTTNEFFDETISGSIPPEYISSCKRGFEEALLQGPLIGSPVTGVRMVVNDGAFHPVDSSDLAFRICTGMAFREGFLKSQPCILEPIMTLSVSAPSEFQQQVSGNLNRRKGSVRETNLTADFITIEAEIPLNNMFGYSTELRSSTQGKGEFTMEYKHHYPVSKETQNQLILEYKKKKAEDLKNQ
jgi:elongation factor G